MTPPAEVGVTCSLCGEYMPHPLDIVAHLKLRHRGVFEVSDEFKRRPDGSPVVVDASLQPKDFT